MGDVFETIVGVILLLPGLILAVLAVREAVRTWKASGFRG